MAFLIAALVAHATIATASPSPWWVPDLATVGVVLAVARRPDRWWLAGALSGVFLGLWTIRHAGWTFIAMVGVGGLARLVTARFDALDWRVVVAAAGAASALVTIGHCWLEGLWAPSLIGWAALRLGLTSLVAAVLARRLVPGEMA